MLITVMLDHVSVHRDRKLQFHFRQHPNVKPNTTHTSVLPWVENLQNSLYINTHRMRGASAFALSLYPSITGRLHVRPGFRYPCLHLPLRKEIKLQHWVRETVYTHTSAGAQMLQHTLNPMGCAIRVVMPCTGTTDPALKPTHTHSPQHARAHTSAHPT